MVPVCAENAQDFDKKKWGFLEWFLSGFGGFFCGGCWVGVGAG